MAGTVTQRVYRVHYYEVDYLGNILPTALVNYFQDLTWVQCEEIGIGMKELYARNLRWVLHQWDITIDKYPQYNEDVIVSTTPVAMDKFNAYRKFEVKNQAGDTLVTAMSHWALINSEAMRLAKITPEIAQSYGLVLGDKSEAPKLGKFQGPQEEQITLDIAMRYSDIDTNRHINNVKYIEWAIETMPLERITDRSLQRIEVLYKSQAEYGEDLKAVSDITVAEDALMGLHKIVGAENKLKCLLRTEWV